MQENFNLFEDPGNRVEKNSKDNEVKIEGDIDYSEGKVKAIVKVNDVNYGVFFKINGQGELLFEKMVVIKDNISIEKDVRSKLDFKLIGEIKNKLSKAIELHKRNNDNEEIFLVSAPEGATMKKIKPGVYIDSEKKFVIVEYEGWEITYKADKNGNKSEDEPSFKQVYGNFDFREHNKKEIIKKLKEKADRVFAQERGSVPNWVIKSSERNELRNRQAGTYPKN